MSKDLECSIKDRVREIAKAENKTFNDVWKTLVLERFLARLSRSPQIDNLIFKGGMLLSKYIPLGRETVDLDFLAVNLSASVDTIKTTVESILNVPSEDGFSFVELDVEQLPQPHMNYPGYGVKAITVLGGTRTSISIDIGIGDVVESAEKNIEFLALKTKPLFEASVALLVYPPEYIFAEKLETAIFRGNTNSRIKDYYDIWTMLRTPSLLKPNGLKEILSTTCAHRNTKIVPLEPILRDSMQRFEREWNVFTRALAQNKEAKIPDSFSIVLTEIDKWLFENSLAALETQNG